ncbi:hypothetical protein ACHAXT_001946 [Thalassiosira profunda]
MPAHTPEALVRAAAPLRAVVDAFLDGEEDAADPLERQGRFAALLLSLASRQGAGDGGNGTRKGGMIDWKCVDFLPSRRYVRKLVQRYASQLEERGEALEDDGLAALVCHFSMERGGDVPDPTCPSIVSFRIPRSNGAKGEEVPQPKVETDILHIRTYPRHNDVGVSKVWEAGACLAEYLMQNPRLIRGRNVIELGAGVGLTGLVAAGVAKAKVHMTDYTEASLCNLAHNMKRNGNWLAGRGVDTTTVTVGRLEWGEHDNDQIALEVGNASEPPWANSVEALSKADVLIAADVVYDPAVVPDLVATVSRFLGANDNERSAIFATTFRNKDTFALFKRELDGKDIICTYDNSLDDLPDIFPCYFNQPRSDVRVCTMKLQNDQKPAT